MQPLQLQLHKAIVFGELPSKIVDIYGVAFVFRLPGYVFQFEDLDHLIIFAETHITCENFPGKEFIRNIPSPLFTVLLKKYREFQEKILPRLMAEMREYTKTAESKFAWAMFQEVGAAMALEIPDGKLTIFQRRWIVENRAADKQNMNKLIGDVFDAVKPWLDKEMWLQMKENEGSLRENVFYDEDAGGIMDEKIRQRAAAAREKKVQPVTPILTSKDKDDDNDIVVIGDE